MAVNAPVVDINNVHAKNVCTTNNPINEEIAKLQEKLQIARTEIEDVKMAALLQQETQHDEVAAVRLKYENEIASLHRILREAVSDAMHHGENERSALRKANQFLQIQLHDMRQHLAHTTNDNGDDDGIISAVFRTLKNTTLTSPSTSTQNFADLTENFNRAAEKFNGNRDKLHAIISPYESEILTLRKENRRLKRTALLAAGDISTACGDEANKNGKETTKADLEIYVAVLNTQKQVLQDDINIFKEKIASLSHLMQKSFTETETLQKQLNEVSQATDGDNSVIIESVRIIEALNLSFLQAIKLTNIPDDVDDRSSLSNFVGSSVDDSVAQNLMNDLPITTNERTRSASANCSTEITSLDLKPEPTRLQTSSNESIPPSSESADTKTIDSSSLHETETTDMTLQQHSLLSAATCEMCSNYEEKLQQSQSAEIRHREEVRTARDLVERYKKELDLENQYRGEIESKATSTAEQVHEKTKQLTEKLAGSETALIELKQICEHNFEQLKRKQLELIEQKNWADAELNKIKNLYEKLLGLHRAKAGALQDAAIEFPQQLDELQLYTLKLREELIEARAANEHLDVSLREDLELMQTQLKLEQTNREQLEANVEDEINQLRTQLAVSISENNKLQEDSRKLTELEQQSANSERDQADLRRRFAESERARKHLESDLNEQKKQFQTLKENLDTNEAVQQDFVRLSQSLQIELEKIRQAEHEVRWQHDDDVISCAQCRKTFVSGQKSRRKLHCWHCGRILCSECLTRMVPSGPNKRLAPVCDVCHTILNQTSAPYFATAPPIQQ